MMGNIDRLGGACILDQSHHRILDGHKNCSWDPERTLNVVEGGERIHGEKFIQSYFLDCSLEEPDTVEYQAHYREC
jgi:hypothetical protein